MTEVNGLPVIDFQMTMDTTTGMYGSFTEPGPGASAKAWHNYRPGDRIVITGHGSPIGATVRSVRWSPIMTEVEWVSGLMMWQKSADEIIDLYAQELAARRPA